MQGPETCGDLRSAARGERGLGCRTGILDQFLFRLVPVPGAMSLLGAGGDVQVIGPMRDFIVRWRTGLAGVAGDVLCRGVGKRPGGVLSCLKSRHGKVLFSNICTRMNTVKRTRWRDARGSAKAADIRFSRGSPLRNDRSGAPGNALPCKNGSSRQLPVQIRTSTRPSWRSCLSPYAPAEILSAGTPALMSDSRMLVTRRALRS